jgi:oligoribonuclease
MPEMFNSARKHQKPTTLIWLDLEMTGLNARTDLITEIAVIVTNYKLEELDRFETTVKYPETTLREKFYANGFWAKRPSDTERLIKDCLDGISLASAQNKLIKLINKHIDTESEAPILAGNSIHADKIFIDAKMKKLSNILHYRLLDVSSYKVWLQGSKGIERKKKQAHRALSDVEESIDELKFALKTLADTK